MLILNSKIQQLLQEQFLFSDDNIDEMVLRYRKAIVDLIVDEIQIFIERNELNEIDESIEQKINTLRQQSKGDMDLYKELYEEYFGLLAKYPDLVAIVNNRIEGLNERLNNDLVESLNDEGKMKLLDIIEEDMQIIKQNEDYAKELMKQFQQV
jgi:hypothetical protein